MSSSYHTAYQIKAQRCIESDPRLFAKQYQEEAFTTEESQWIVQCALPTQEEAQAERTAGLVVGTIASVAILATIIFGAITIYKSHKECKEAEEAWQRAHKKHMEELDRLIAEANQSSKKGKKSGSK